MVKNLQLLHEHSNEDSIRKLRRICLMMFKVYSNYLNVSLVGILVLKLAGFGPFKMLHPAIYDSLVNDGPAFYFLLFIHFLSVVCIIYLITVGDLFPIMCMMRLGANVKLLCNDLKNCANNKNVKINEQNLLACVRYHEALMR